MSRIARELRVRGVVQGVGFRPFVFRLASELGLHGSVRNLGDAGVEIVLEGDAGTIDAFLRRLPNDAPPLARVECVDVREVAPAGADGFAIRSSGAGHGGAGALPPDIAVCDDCLEDLAAHPRYGGYWATTCTNCGPRFTVINALPYDRSRTSMDAFPMCDACSEEYTEPADRRYHAQTIACPACGPMMSFDGESAGWLERCRDALLAGDIIAIKGIGGTHLACDAMDAAAVARLRDRLGRTARPFALMATEATAREIAKIDDEEWTLLRSSQRPIVVVRQHPGRLPDPVAPGLHTVGIMLPYSGVHHLLLDGLGRPLVMTSANAPGRPMLIDNEQILGDLANVADHFLLHDRRIAARCDDSVVRRSGGDVRFLRRSRGYVPEAIALPLGGQPILALGGETDVAFAIHADDRVVLSQHIGSVDNPESLRFLREAIDHLTKITASGTPHVIACDLHPGFETSRLATELAAAHGAERVAVQHHEAHVAAVLAEHRARDAVGIALDGYGYGPDGAAWGGEIFVVADGVLRRRGTLVPVGLPGGDLATRRPLRLLASYLHAAGLEPQRIREEVTGRGMHRDTANLLLQQLERDVNVPRATSAGRFLDAASALSGVCVERTYEGEPAMRLEATAAGGEALPIPIKVRREGSLLQLDVIAAMAELLQRAQTTSPADLAAAAQWFLADGVADVAIRLARESGLPAVALSGGVAYNDAISTRLRARVEDAGLTWLAHRQLPCGDGGLAFGQAVLAAGRGRIPVYGQ
jgi:hydrogenase maturation protein HypF